MKSWVSSTVKDKVVNYVKKLDITKLATGIVTTIAGVTTLVSGIATILMPVPGARLVGAGMIAGGLGILTFGASETLDSLFGINPLKSFVVNTLGFSEDSYNLFGLISGMASAAGMEAAGPWLSGGTTKAVSKKPNNSNTNGEIEINPKEILLLPEGKVGNFTNVESVHDFIGRVPDNAKRLPWKNVAGGAKQGIKYEWIDEVGNKFQARAHEMDPSAPLGANASEGWIYRIQVKYGGKGKWHYMDSTGNFHMENVLKENSPFYNETIANDTHIPFKR